MEIQERELEELENIRESYYELIMAVENKYPNENRHQTALRLIKESQKSGIQSKKVITNQQDQVVSSQGCYYCLMHSLPVCPECGKR